MRKIPNSLKQRLSEDPFMNICCIPDCYTTADWEHSWIYSNRQIGGDFGEQDWWAIVPMCYPHHQGDLQTFELNGQQVRSKEYGQWISLKRGIDIAKKNYPKFDWQHQLNVFNKKFV